MALSNKTFGVTEILFNLENAHLNMCRSKGQVIVESVYTSRKTTIYAEMFSTADGKNGSSCFSWSLSMYTDAVTTYKST